MPLPITDTRQAFRPLSREIVAVLRTLRLDDWGRPTMAGSWRVRDVVAHLVDTALRRLSFHRDGSAPRTSLPRDVSDGPLVAFINELNATWIRAAERLSGRVLTDLYARTSAELADFVETLDLHAAARFPVSWAGESESTQWLDIGREFTEVWHHGSQIRELAQACSRIRGGWRRSCGSPCTRCRTPIATRRGVRACRSRFESLAAPPACGHSSSTMENGPSRRDNSRIQP